MIYGTNKEKYCKIFAGCGSLPVPKAVEAFYVT
jgi:hypothetical protein